MRRWLIEKLGGYPDLHSALEAARGMSLVERNKVLTLAVKRLFNTIGVEDILKVYPGDQWLFEGKTLPVAQVKLLRTEATAFAGSFFWKVVSRELRYIANKKMYLESEDVIDMVAGKLLAYYIDIVQQKIKSMIVENK